MDRRRFLVSVSAVGTVSIAGCSSSGSTSVPTDDPKAVTEAYFNAKWSDDPGTMERLVHSEATAADELEMRARESTKEVTQVETDGKYGDVTVVFLYNNEEHEQSPLQVYLRLEEGDWKVVPGCPTVDPELCSIE